MIRRAAFTLIELLIVVAIIAVLAAIAVPNFLEAQTRSKISRGKADMRSLGVAIEAYRTDQRGYPLPKRYSNHDQVYELTSPVAYMTSLPKDPYGMAYLWGTDSGCGSNAGKPLGFTFFFKGYQYLSFKKTKKTSSDPVRTWRDAALGTTNGFDLDGWVLKSFGPDKAWNCSEWYALGYNPKYYRIDSLYDPTNGTISNGDIIRLGGMTSATASSVASK